MNKRIVDIKQNLKYADKSVPKEDVKYLLSKYNKMVKWIKEEAYLSFKYQDYMHSEGENTIEGARDLLRSIGELKK